MLQCKTCGEVFPGTYVAEGGTDDSRASATNVDRSHACSRGFVVFVKGGKVGQNVKIKVEQVGNRFATATLLV